MIDILAAIHALIEESDGIHFSRFPDITKEALKDVLAPFNDEEVYYYFLNRFEDAGEPEDNLLVAFRDSVGKPLYLEWGALYQNKNGGKGWQHIDEKDHLGKLGEVCSKLEIEDDLNSIFGLIYEFITIGTRVTTDRGGFLYKLIKNVEIEKGVKRNKILALYMLEDSGSIRTLYMPNYYLKKIGIEGEYNND